MFVRAFDFSRCALAFVLLVFLLAFGVHTPWHYYICVCGVCECESCEFFFFYFGGSSTVKFILNAFQELSSGTRKKRSSNRTEQTELQDVANGNLFEFY